MKTRRGRPPMKMGGPEQDRDAHRTAHSGYIGGLSTVLQNVVDKPSHFTASLLYEVLRLTYLAENKRLHLNGYMCPFRWRRFILSEGPTPHGRDSTSDVRKGLNSVCYPSFDQAPEIDRNFGPGALMAKADIEAAFRLLPIHPDGFNSLGFQFNGSFYVDKCLPMGCILSCSYFEFFSSFLKWVVAMHCMKGGIVHYFYDILFVVPKGSGVCNELLNTFMLVCNDFGIPLASGKTVFPWSCIEYLGILIDTVKGEFRLPVNKVEKCVHILFSIYRSKKSTVKEVESLLGLLAFASRVIPMGRVFHRRLAMHIAGIRNSSFHVQITREIKEDLEVWLRYLHTEQHYNDNDNVAASWIGKHRVTKRRPALSSPMFTLVTWGLWHRWSLESCLCDSSPATTQGLSNDHGQVVSTVVIIGKLLSVTVPLEFLRNFNGIAVWRDPFVTAGDLNLVTDASGSVGFGAYWNSKWSCATWHRSWVVYGVTKNMVLLELFLVVVALALWGSRLANKCILLRSDNKRVPYFPAYKTTF
ncbi:unnamed protein product, partial [Ranitomeya imitator]